MSIKMVQLKCHDLQPFYRFSVPKAITLSGATITCTMCDRSGTKIVNRQPCVITDAAACEAEYRWQPGDTDIPGAYFIEFEVVPADGKKFTVPTEGRAQVLIRPDNDGV